MTLEEWEGLEAETWHLYEEHIDEIRIRAFAIALSVVVNDSSARLEKALAGVERARKKAEQELRAFNRTCEFAENMGRFAARVMGGDVDEVTRRSVAAMIEEAIE